MVVIYKKLILIIHIFADFVPWHDLKAFKVNGS